MADILLTNDDGYKSVGFLSLLKELSKQFSVVAVAPSEEKSWVGKSISSKKELELQKVKIGDFDILSLNGTPADCAQVGLYNVLERKPKLVVSGINTGTNVGAARILSSGTIGAAMEASLDGLKAIASSVYFGETGRSTDFFDAKNYKLFENAAKITTKIIRIFLESGFEPGVDVISINMPFGATPDTQAVVTVPFKESYGKLFHKKGDKFVLKVPYLDFKDLKEGTDLKALHEGKVSVTPISLEMASKDALKRIGQIIEKEW